ncbi:BREX system P-loop protein BrxC [Nibrella viscosa]|uniref:BREX system P-loop protein BrxC n=1 Tax=Nibrella viscosa TaxID=1084524 RepID=A0ABP8K1X8_9BACT
MPDIKDLFLKPVDRRINPAVVVDNLDEETIQTEIREYVFTDGLTEQLFKLLNTLAGKAAVKTGIWINGYYGSGKSHFLKFINYCLNDRYQEEAFAHFIEQGIRPLSKGKPLTEATPANAQNLLAKLRGSGTEVIMFNVEAISPDNVQNKDKFLHMLLKQLNKHRGFNSTNIPLALYLEKHLAQTGTFQTFKDAVLDRYKKSWPDKAADLFALHGRKLVELAAQFDPALDAETLFQKLRQPDAITIEDTLIPELQEYLRTKPANYRLVFLLDEVSQYIGSDINLLLNLQTIVEALEKSCNRQVWLACTAQQTLEDVAGSVRADTDAIGKILGRFETRIALDSKDAELITQRRVLEKNDTGKAELKQLYQQHHHAIQNQFHFAGASSYRGFSNEDEFIRVYPFVPYQFHLIMKVFESFSQIGYVIKEVKDNERSVLGITHATVKTLADQPVGEFVPFDAFFNDLFETNLMHSARQSVYRARLIVQNPNNRLPDIPFAERVLKALFMLANLTSTEARHFPATRDYLVTLLMTGLDDNRLDLANRAQQVIDVLIRENIIYQDENGQFKFFKEEEIEVANQIKSITVLELDRLDAWHKVFLNELNLNRETRYTFGKNNFRLGYGVDKKDYGQAGDVLIRFFVLEDADPATLALNQPAHELAVCLNDWLKNDRDFAVDFHQYVQTQKYLGLYYNSAAGAQADTLREFEKRNQARQASLLTRLKAGFAQTPILAGQQRLNPGDLTGTQPDQRLKAAIERLFKAVYKYQTEVGSYAHANDELRAAARTLNQLSTDNTLTDAEQRVDDWINQRGGKATVADIVKAFEEKPFGWKDLATLHVLLHLYRKKRKEFEYHGNPMTSPTDFVEKALKSTERGVILIRTTEALDPGLIQDAIRAYGRIFNLTVNLAPDANAVQAAIKETLQQETDRWSTLATRHAKLPFAPSLQTLAEKIRTLAGKRNPKDLFELLVQQADTLRQQCDEAKELDEFIEDRLAEYADMRQFVEQQAGNFAALDATTRQSAQELQQDLTDNTRPQDTFPANRKRYQALKKALGDQVTSLRQRVQDAYEAAFAELEQQKTDYGVTDPHILADRDQTLRALGKLDSLTELELKLARLGDFKAEQLQNLISHANQQATPGSTVREPVTFEYGKQGLPSQISSEAEMETYLKKLRELWLAQLKENKVIILK